MSKLLYSKCILWGLFASFFLFTISSCSKDDDGASDNQILGKWSYDKRYTNGELSDEEDDFSLCPVKYTAFDFTSETEVTIYRVSDCTPKGSASATYTMDSDSIFFLDTGSDATNNWAYKIEGNKLTFEFTEGDSDGTFNYKLILDKE